MTIVVRAWPETLARAPAAKSYKRAIKQKGAGIWGRHGGIQRLSDEHVRQIREMHEAGFTFEDIACFWGLHYYTAYSLCTGRSRPFAGGDFPKKQDKR